MTSVENVRGEVGAGDATSNVIDSGGFKVVGEEGGAGVDQAVLTTDGSGVARDVSGMSKCTCLSALCDNLLVVKIDIRGV